MFVGVMQALLAAPEPDDPQDAVVARQVNFSPSISFQPFWGSKKAIQKMALCGVELLFPSLICNISFFQYQESFPVYKATAQHWSHVYAGSEHRVFDHKILQTFF